MIYFLVLIIICLMLVPLLLEAWMKGWDRTTISEAIREIRRNRDSDDGVALAVKKTPSNKEQNDHSGAVNIPVPVALAFASILGAVLVLLIYGLLATSIRPLVSNILATIFGGFIAGAITAEMAFRKPKNLLFGASAGGGTILVTMFILKYWLNVAIGDHPILFIQLILSSIAGIIGYLILNPK